MVEASFVKAGAYPILKMELFILPTLTADKFTISDGLNTAIKNGENGRVVRHSYLYPQPHIKYIILGDEKKA
jgi:hypothetical protein